MEFLQLMREIGFMLYAALKAFLPLPSLEVLLIPLCVNEPHAYLRFALEGSVGTCIGGAIGYLLAKKSRKGVLHHFLDEQQINHWEQMMKKYGIFTVFIGGITPIPDFILPYLAGFTNMNFWLFSFSDCSSRFIRSWFIGYSIEQAAHVIDFQTYGNLLCVFILLWSIIYWIKGRYFIIDNG